MQSVPSPAEIIAQKCRKKVLLKENKKCMCPIVIDADSNRQKKICRKLICYGKNSSTSCYYTSVTWASEFLDENG